MEIARTRSVAHLLRHALRRGLRFGDGLGAPGAQAHLQRALEQMRQT